MMTVSVVAPTQFRNPCSLRHSSRSLPLKPRWTVKSHN
jgi:hypothetical protein